MGSSVISLGLGLGCGKAATSSGTLSASGLENTYSIDLDGTDDDIRTNYTPPAGLGTFSMSFWLKTSSAGFYTLGGAMGNNSIAFQGPTLKTATSTGSGFIMGWDGWNSGWNPSGLGGAGAALDLFDGLWHNLTYTINETSVKLYKDGGDAAINASNTSNNQGTPFGSITASSALSNNGFDQNSTYSYVIGSHRTGYRFNGLLDEVAMFETELSGSDVSAIYNNGIPTDLTSYSPSGWWRMGDNDGGTGTTITDQGSRGNNGTLTNFSTGTGFSTDVPS